MSPKATYINTKHKNNPSIANLLLIDFFPRFNGKHKKYQGMVGDIFFNLEGVGDFLFFKNYL